VLHKSLSSACVIVYPSIVGRQRLGKNVTSAKNTHETIEEMMEASFSKRSMSRKVGDYFFPEFLF
jgi:hypothetical protein